MTEMSHPGAGTERSNEGSATDSVKDAAQQVTSQVGEKARDLRGQAGDRARDQVDQRSTMAGEQMTGIADALRRTGSQLRDEGKSQPAGLAEEAAQRVERLGSYLRDSDADKILRDVEQFARRQPWLVGAGGLVAGLFASRLLKASSSRRYEGENGGRSIHASRPRTYGELNAPSVGTDEPIARSGVGV